MTSTLEHPAEEKEKMETIPTATPESPVEVVGGMTRGSMEASVGAVHETTQQAVNELEGFVRDLVGTAEKKPEKKPEE